MDGRLWVADDAGPPALRQTRPRAAVGHAWRREGQSPLVLTSAGNRTGVGPSLLRLASGLLTNDEALRRRIRQKAKAGLLLSAKRHAEADRSRPHHSILLLNARRNRSLSPTTNPHSVALLSGPTTWLGSHS